MTYLTPNQAASLYRDILVYASANGSFFRIDLNVDNDGYFNNADLFPLDGYGARDTDNDGVSLHCLTWTKLERKTMLLVTTTHPMSM